MNWYNTQASFRAHGALSESPADAAAKWTYLLTARYCLIGAAIAFALAALVAVVPEALPRAVRKRACHAVAALLSAAGVGATVVSIACYAYLHGKVGGRAMSVHVRGCSRARASSVSTS